MDIEKSSFDIVTKFEKLSLACANATIEKRQANTLLAY